MKISDTRAFVNQFLIGLLVTIGFGGTVGLGTVWMRHQVSVVADENRVLQQKIDDVDRQIASMTALVEAARSNDVLRSKNESMQLGLTEMTQTQVVAVNEDPVARLVARTNRRLFEAEPGSRTIGIQLHLDEPAPAAMASTATHPPAATKPPARSRTNASAHPANLQLAITE